ncbi:hypothetical protein MUY21_02770 [Aliiroseovarius sp. S2029]|uniref:hypothetical protein n=1 Tax=Aliiroseovarius sp. S2029 TaxID=2936988 RepID=UPI0020BF270F|nr:hypothetical protein [Aliiroseovarius sp. S2029]MCK8482949.1 hypothetical protein [Aliiroseovarius sp. S2029]
MKPVGGGAHPPRGAAPVYIQEIIARLNSIFGQATPSEEQISFVNQNAAIASNNEVVMAQVENNSNEQALKEKHPVLWTIGLWISHLH